METRIKPDPTEKVARCGIVQKSVAPLA